jgi:hypothetical protein
MRPVLSLIALALAGVAAAPPIAERRWRKSSEEMVRGMRTACASQGEPIGESDWDRLPPAVAAYFRRALPLGQPLTAVQIEQVGQMLINDRWRDFSAVEHLSTRPRSFVWDARMRMAPFVYTLLRDAYIDGTASMAASLAGLFRVADERGGEALNAGALYRYLAEATWMPAALLPRSGVVWSAVDETRALATLSDAGTTVALEFTFNMNGEPIRIFTPSRCRTVDGHFEPTPWQGRFGNYAERCGMWIPLEAEVSWQIAGSWQPWWRGRIVGVHPL